MRHRQKFLVKIRSVDDRPLHQRRHFVEQGIVMRQCCAEFFGLAVQLAFNGVAARVETGNDLAFFQQGGFVVIGVSQSNILLAEKTVAVRDIAADQSQRFHRQYCAAPQRDQAVCRPDELHAFQSAGDLIGHDLWNWQLIDRVFQCRLERGLYRLANSDRRQVQHLYLAVAAAFDRAQHGFVAPDGGQLLE